MTKTIAARTFTATTEDGTVLYSGRGKEGAAQKALDALYAHRSAVKAGSGYLYGNPMSLGGLKVDGEAVSCQNSAEDLARYSIAILQG